MARLQKVEAEMDKLKANASQMETTAQDRFNEKVDPTNKDLHRPVKDVAAPCR